MKTSILTSSGHYFDYINVSKNVVLVSDVAHGLSQECRFASQCPKFYSVAQHSVLVSWIVECLGGRNYEQRQALLHDASEAFMKDIPSPLKSILPGYREVEERVQRDLMRRFGLGYVLSPLVKQADLIALAVEKRDLLSNNDQWYVLQDTSLDDPRLEGVSIVQPLLPEDARHQWEAEYRHLFVDVEPTE